ncbi:MAG: efflux RND transporter periplasmic adaptor subunit [Rhodospirillaceae bacterium]
MNDTSRTTETQDISGQDALDTPMDPQGKWGLIAGGILGVGILGFILLQALSSDPEQVARDSRAPLVQVVPLTIQNQPLMVQGDGPVRPRAQVTLIAQVSGTVVNTGAALVTGGTFKQGDVLAQIDPRPYEAALAQANAERAARQADLDLADRQLQRDQQLSESGAASERRRDETLNQRDRTKAQIGGLNAQIVLREIDLERTTLTAPFDGQVLSENVDVGSVVQPGVEIARLFATDMYEIVVPLSDRAAALIPGIWDPVITKRPSATATLSYRGRLYTWDGYVDRVEAGIDAETRTIDVVVRVPNPMQRGRLVGPPRGSAIADAPPFLAGTYAAIEIEGVVLPHAVIPRAGLRNNNTIWLARTDDTLEIVTVDVLQDQGNDVVISGEDLTNGARLVVSELNIGTTGLPVQVAEQQATPDQAAPVGIGQ